MLARGPDVSRLAKAGLAIDSTPAFKNPKEATVAAISSRQWRLYFEYARDGASLIGQALTGDLDGPWQDLAEAPLAPRPDAWDCWHLSPGPVIGERGDGPVMFYNGATQDAAWRIGWATFDSGLAKVVDRCDEPLVVPQVEVSEGASDIAFAASAVERDGEVLLYFSQSDQDLRCATVRLRSR